MAVPDHVEAEPDADADASPSASAPDVPEVRFFHKIFCQVGLPRRRIAAREFTRRNGAAWLTVQAGYIDEPGTGRVVRDVPHGVMPRLILAWICSQVVKAGKAGTGSRPGDLELDLASSPRELLRQLGLDGQGRRYTALRDGLHDLSAARFQLGFQTRTLNISPIKELNTWGAPGGARLVISQDFVSALRKHAVPLDLRALVYLSGSALELDLYTWLAERLFRLEKPLEHTWLDLHRDLGQEHQGLRAADNFRKEVQRHLPRVLEAYPSARVSALPGGAGLHLFPSNPSVAEL